MNKIIFKDFDLSTFWDDDDYALKEYVDEYPSDELINSIEQELKYKLPASYIELMKMHNGGTPFENCFPTKESTSWASDHVAITGILGIGRNKTYSLCGSLGSRFMISEWGYPDIGICICDCPSAGHDMIMLDYSKCGNNGEPQVVHVDQENDYKITFLAENFEIFIKGLVSSDIYNPPVEEQLKSILEILKIGTFSVILQRFFRSENEVDFDKILRKILIELTNTKGYFGLHSDELSYLVYDIQFYLFSKNEKLGSKDEYLKEYPKMIAFSDGDISTKGYAMGFIEKWIDKRLTEKKIIRRLFGNLTFSKNYRETILNKVKKYV